MELAQAGRGTSHALLCIINYSKQEETYACISDGKMSLLYNPAEGRQPLFASGQSSQSETLASPMIKSLYPSSSGGKESACNAGDPSSIPRLGISPGEGNGNPLQYSYLENSMDRRTWPATVHGTVKSRTWRATNTYTINSNSSDYSWINLRLLLKK